jgi:ABC-type multidrug transport system fused ATPase/permease subunit
MNNYSIISSDSEPKVNGEISFLPSQPWLMTETIKNNILFFSELNEIKYNEIISLCHLNSDFYKLPERDLTIVNSTCSNIS